MRAVASPRARCPRAILCTLLSLAAVNLGGCDSSESGATRTDGGKRPRPASTFSQEDPTARQVQGLVLLGTEPVPNASIHLEPGAGLAAEVRLPDVADPFLTSTDLGGRYRIFSAPIPYDLSVRKDREVVVYRGLGRRNFDPSLGRDADVRGFTSRIAATTEPPPAPGNTVAFMIEGQDARALSGDPGSLLATFRRFDTTITLHAIEYAGGGLATAVRAGKVNVLVHDGGAAVAVVPIAHESASTVNDIRFIALPPAGFALSMVDVVMDFGLRTATRPVASVAAGTPLHIAIVADARYFARVRAVRAGAISDSGLLRFNPADAAVALTLPAPVTETAFNPNPGSFSATTKGGVVEHVLVPSAAGGIALRLATATGLATLPDLTALGVARLVGTYSWSVQYFSALQHVEDLGGEDGRVTTPVSVTAPIAIELR